MNLYRLGTHGLRPLESEVQASGRIHVRSKQGHSKESKAGPFWHAA
jgi:hypothetical protein